MSREKGMMDYEQFKQMILNLDSADFIEEIALAGIGEPTLHPDLIKMISFIKKNTRLKVVLTTNASKFNRQSFIDELLASNLDKITVSLRISDHIRNKTSLSTDIDYAEYTNSILKLIETVFKSNCNTEIEVAFFKETYYSKYILDIKTVDFINTKLLNGFFSKFSRILETDLPSYDDYTRGISSRLSNVDRIPITKGISLRFDGLSSWTSSVEKYKDTKKAYPAKYGSCFGLSEHFAIYCNGDVSTCCADFNVKNRLGNIFDEKDIIKILSKKKSLFYADSLSRKRMPTITCQICRGGKTRREKWASMIGTLAFVKSSAS
jgi:MoaA/NifB/PqqE/SkfB family radical SAM enzyme